MAYKKVISDVKLNEEVLTSASELNDYINSTPQIISGARTFTGNETHAGYELHKGSGVIRQFTDIDVTTPPSTNLGKQVSAIVDANNESIGVDEIHQLTDNSLIRNIGAVIRKIGDVFKSCYLQCILTENGTRVISLENADTVYVNTPIDASNGKEVATTNWVRTRLENWLNSLRQIWFVVHNGGFVTQYLDIASNAVTPAANKSANYAVMAYDSTWFGGFQSIVKSDGGCSLYLVARKNINSENKDAGIYLEVNNTGASSISLTTHPDVTSNDSSIATTSYVRQLMSKIHRVVLLEMTANNTMVTTTITGCLPNTSYSIVFTATSHASTTTTTTITYQVNGSNQTPFDIKRYGLIPSLYNAMSDANGYITVGVMCSAYSYVRAVKVDAYLN